MVANLLVNGRMIEAGRKFILGLVRDGFEVAVAFWAQVGDRGPWHLYIASRSVIPGRLGDIAQLIYKHVSQVASSALDFSQIRLISDTDPTAREAIEHRDRNWGGGSQPVEVFGQLRNLAIEWAYIYERILASLTRDEVIQNVLRLMERPGGQPPSKFVRRDGSTVQGMPVGLVTQAPGTEVLVSVVDPAMRTTDFVPAADIVSIE